MTTLQLLCADAGSLLRRFCINDSGATAIEYAIIAVGISIVIIAAVTSIGSSVNNAFTSVSNGL